MILVGFGGVIFAAPEIRQHLGIGLAFGAVFDSAVIVQGVAADVYHAVDR